MRCAHCHAPYDGSRGLIVHGPGCPQAQADSEMFGIGVEFIPGGDETP